MIDLNNLTKSLEQIKEGLSKDGSFDAVSLLNEINRREAELRKELENVLKVSNEHRDNQ